jgi:hypothetical protein
MTYIHVHDSKYDDSLKSLWYKLMCMLNHVESHGESCEI